MGDDTTLSEKGESPACGELAGADRLAPDHELEMWLKDGRYGEKHWIFTIDFLRGASEVDVFCAETE